MEFGTNKTWGGDGRAMQDRYGWAVVWPGGFRSAMPDEATAKSAAVAARLMAVASDFVRYMEDADYRAECDRHADEETAGNVTYMEGFVSVFQVAIDVAAGNR